MTNQMGADGWVMTDYVEILTLKLTHDFYASGTTPDFEIVPLGTTRTLMAQHRLLFKVTAGEARLIAQVEGGRPIVDLSELEALAFGLVLRNPRFLAFTDAPETKPAHTAALAAGPQAGQLFFAQTPVYVRTNRDGGAQLSEGAAYDFFDALPLTLMTNATHGSAAITLKDTDGRTVRQQILHLAPGATAETSTKGYANASMDVATLPRGLYTLSSDHPDQADVTVLLREGLARPYFRSIWLRFPKEQFALPDGALKPATQISTAFTAARKTWTYHISVGSRRADKALSVKHAPTDGEAEILFDAPVEVPTSNGGKRWTVLSTAPVSFQEKPRKKISLLEVEQAGEGEDPATKEIIGNLPSPAPGEASADVYVHV